MTLIQDLLNRRPDHYQSFHDPVSAPGLHDTQQFWAKAGMPNRLDQYSFLDIGCCTGSYLVEAMSRGASVITGIDECADKCDWAREFLTEVTPLLTRWDSPQVTIHKGIFPAVTVEPHDFVIALAVIHHAEYPLQFLRSLYEHTNKCLWIEWELWDSMLVDTTTCLRINKITHDPMPLVPGAPYGRGAYPTDIAAIQAMYEVGFTNIRHRGRVRQGTTAGNRQVFECRK